MSDSVTECCTMSNGATVCRPVLVFLTAAVVQHCTRVTVCCIMSDIVAECCTIPNGLTVCCSVSLLLTAAVVQSVTVTVLYDL